MNNKKNYIESINNKLKKVRYKKNLEMIDKIVDLFVDAGSEEEWDLKILLMDILSDDTTPKQIKVLKAMLRAGKER
jgi:hypothetical protein